MKMISTSRTQLAVHDEGEGHPILLVHGFPLDHTMWRAQIAALAGPYRVIAPDLPGFGQSPACGETNTMNRFATDLIELLDALNVDRPVTFIGLSMGGYIGWKFAQLAGDRLHSLIQCDTKAASDPSDVRQKRYELAEYVLANGVDEMPESMLPRLLAPHTRQRDPELVSTLTEMMKGSSREGVAAASRGMGSREDATHRLSSFTIPTLLICGEHDSISTVDEMRTLAEALPQSELSIIPDAGHLAPLENPIIVNEVITEFLMRLASSHGQV